MSIICPYCNTDIKLTFAKTMIHNCTLNTCVVFMHEKNPDGGFELSQIDICHTLKPTDDLVIVFDILNIKAQILLWNSIGGSITKVVNNIDYNIRFKTLDEIISYAKLIMLYA